VVELGIANMATVSKPYFSEAEYLARERRAEHKCEYVRGEIFAMAGATREHNLIVAAVVRSLGNQLAKRPCEVYPSDMRVRIPSGLYTYPDVTVACGEPKLLDQRRDTLLNPMVIVDVLSESTEAYDRGKKSEHYRQIASLRHYLLVAADRAHIEVYTRRDDQTWQLTEATGLHSTIELSAIECRLELAEVYDKVALEQNEGTGPAESPKAC
jgi:Uma2 family endonuclease